LRDATFKGLEFGGGGGAERRYDCCCCLYEDMLGLRVSVDGFWVDEEGE